MIEIEKEFEREFEEHIQSTINKYNKRHKNKFLRWLGKPNYYNKMSMEYGLHKGIAKLFFAKGIIYHQQEVRKMLKSQGLVSRGEDGNL